MKALRMGRWRQSEINGENVESGKAEECVMEMHTDMRVINEELGEVKKKREHVRCGQVSRKG